MRQFDKYSSKSQTIRKNLAIRTKMFVKNPYIATEKNLV